jgi:hypothetical protein
MACCCGFQADSLHALLVHFNVVLDGTVSAGDSFWKGEVAVEPHAFPLFEHSDYLLLEVI